MNDKDRKKTLNKKILTQLIKIAEKDIKMGRFTTIEKLKHKLKELKELKEKNRNNPG